MKKILPVLMSIGLFSACQKQNTEVQQQQPAQESSVSETTVAQQPPADITPGIAQRPPTESYDLFYTKLEPHGSWFETTDYGFVWQPREAQSHQWRPYLNGHWVYTDVGWTWVSEEPFGWATYHYGRWTRLRDVGWIWVPGEEWAPAWVSWRKSDDYVGWAPLPPEARLDHNAGIRNWADTYYDIGPTQYCFVPVAHFGASRLEQTVAPPEQNVTIISRTTNITNITFNNRTVVNEGPDYDQIRSRSEVPIQRLKIERKEVVDAANAPKAPVVRGEMLEITAPVVRRTRSTDRPREVKQKISQVAVERGWSDAGDAPEVNQIREKMKAEATPPADAPPKSFVNTAPEATPEAAAKSSIAPSSPSVASSPSVRPIETGSGIAAPNASPSPSVTPAGTPLEHEYPSPTPSPIGRGVPGAVGPAVPPTGAQTQPPRVGDKLKSQAQRFNPRRTEPMPSPTQKPGPSSSATASATPVGSPHVGENPEPSAQPTHKRPNGAQQEPSLPPRRKPGGRPERTAGGSVTPAHSPTPTPTPAER